MKQFNHHYVMLLACIPMHDSVRVVYTLHVHALSTCTSVWIVPAWHKHMQRVVHMHACTKWVVYKRWYNIVITNGPVLSRCHVVYLINADVTFLFETLTVPANDHSLCMLILYVESQGKKWYWGARRSECIARVMCSKEETLLRFT